MRLLRRAGGTITAGQLVQQIRLVASQKAFSGLILRVDSPGGDALASDLIWRELRVLAEKKPVIASMGDVAASGAPDQALLCSGNPGPPHSFPGRPAADPSASGRRLTGA